MNTGVHVKNDTVRGRLTFNPNHAFLINTIQEEKGCGGQVTKSSDTGKKCRIYRIYFMSILLLYATLMRIHACLVKFSVVSIAVLD